MHNFDPGCQFSRKSKFLPNHNNAEENPPKGRLRKGVKPKRLSNGNSWRGTASINLNGSKGRVGRAFLFVGLRYVRLSTIVAEKFNKIDQPFDKVSRATVHREAPCMYRVFLAFAVGKSNNSTCGFLCGVEKYRVIAL